MLRQAELYGQRFEFRSIDGGRTWSSDPRSLIAFKKRRERACADVRKRFELIDEQAFNSGVDDIFQLCLPRDFAGET